MSPAGLATYFNSKKYPRRGWQHNPALVDVLCLCWCLANNKGGLPVGENTNRGGEWQKEIVRKRIKDTQPEEYLSWKEVEERLRLD